ncbi:MAG: HEAT repeat domain-containing protein [Phycisphaerales bacterium]|nr:MAG: HEAT repeat domain-containing protein [Phycisphaerales bacterium]
MTLQVSRNVPVLLVTCACVLLGPNVGIVGAFQLPGIGDEASWRERKLRELKSDDVNIRRGAASALIRDDIDGAKLIDAIIPVMSDEDFRVRRSAIIALRIHGVGRSDVAVAFRKALADCDPRLASDLIHALRVVEPNPEESLDAFVIAALRDDRIVTPNAIRAMKEIGAPAVDALVKLLKEPSWLIREEAIAALASLGEAARPALPQIVDAATAPNAMNMDIYCPKLVTWSDQAVAELIKVLQQDPESRANVAGDCLASMEEKAAPAVPALLEIAEAARNTTSVRSACIRTLARVGHSRDEVLHSIMKLAEGDHDKHLRESALNALGVFGERGAPAVPLLAAVVRDDDEALLKRAAFHSLVWIKPEADVVVPLCIKVLGGDGSEDLKETAAWALSEYGSEAAEAWPALKPMLKTKGHVRRAAIRAMVAMEVADLSVSPDLRTAVREGERFEREAAIKALAQLGSSASDAVPDLLQVVRSDANNAASAAHTLGMMLADAATVPPEITGEMRRWYDKGRRLQRERRRRSAPDQAGSVEHGTEDAPQPNEITGDVLLDGVGVMGVRVALTPTQGNLGEKLEVRIATTDDLGTFRFSHVSQGRYRLVAVHPDHEPSLVSVQLERSSRTRGGGQQITLRSTDLKTFTVVNDDDATLPNVVVRINKYRSIPMPPIELRTDASGAFSFPLGTGFVSGEAEHPGYMRTRFVLSQDGDKSRVLMRRPYRISGKVADAKTGTPIPSFTVTRGLRLSVAPALLEVEDEPLGSFTGGAYEILFEESANLPSPFNQMALAFDAPGYQQGMSPSYEEGSGDLVFDIELVPQGGTEGRLIDADGKPVAGADVVLAAAEPMTPVSLLNGHPDWALDRLPRFTTDAEGRFAFPAQSRRFALLVADDRGFAFVMDGAFAEQPKVQLTPWARLSGFVRSGNEVISGAHVDILVESLAEPIGAVATDAVDASDKLSLPGGEDSWLPSFRYSVKTDERGRFSVDRVRPGRVRVAVPVEVSTNTFVSVVKNTLELTPGEVREISFGGGGRRVIGRIDLPKQPSRFGGGFEPCRARFGGVVFDRTAQPQPSLQEAINARRLPKSFYPFGFQEDGVFTINDVEPGKYRLVIGLRCVDGLAPPDHVVDHEFDVPKGDLDVPFNLGELKTTPIQEPE